MTLPKSKIRVRMNSIPRKGEGDSRHLMVCPHAVRLRLLRADLLLHRHLEQISANEIRRRHAARPGADGDDLIAGRDIEAEEGPQRQGFAIKHFAVAWVPDGKVAFAEWGVARGDEMLSVLGEAQVVDP